MWFLSISAASLNAFMRWLASVMALIVYASKANAVRVANFADSPNSAFVMLNVSPAIRVPYANASVAVQCLAAVMLEADSSITMAASTMRCVIMR